MHRQLTVVQVKAATDALREAAFNIETVAHMCAEERRLLPVAEALRAVMAAIHADETKIARNAGCAHKFAGSNATQCAVCGENF